MPTTPTEIDVYQIRPGAAYQIVGTNSVATQDTYLTLSGTSNEIIVTNSGTAITLSTPQAIATTSSPTFQQLTLGSTTLGGVVFNDTEATPKTIKLEAPTTITLSYTLKWPASQGGSSTFLENDGSGNLNWSSGSGANTALSNLSSVAINTSLLPASNASINFGSSSLDWLDTYAEINQIAQAQAGDQTIASGFNASVPISHTIPVGHTLFVSLGSFFQVT